MVSFPKPVLLDFFKSRPRIERPKVDRVVWANVEFIGNPVKRTKVPLSEVLANPDRFPESCRFYTPNPPKQPELWFSGYKVVDDEKADVWHMEPPDVLRMSRKYPATQRAIEQNREVINAARQNKQAVQLSQLHRAPGAFTARTLFHAGGADRLRNRYGGKKTLLEQLAAWVPVAIIGLLLLVNFLVFSD